MGTFLGVVSILGLLGCIIWLIYCLVKKKKFKNSLIGLGVFVVIFIIALAITPDNVSETTDGTTLKSPNTSSTNENITAESTTKNDTTKISKKAAVKKHKTTTTIKRSNNTDKKSNRTTTKRRNNNTANNSSRTTKRSDNTPKKSNRTTAKKPTTKNNSIGVVSLTSPIPAGEIASITIKSLPNTNYSITVYYNSGASKADGLYSKKSDSNGKVSWSWEVGARTKPGSYKIYISGGGKSITTYFTVT